VFRRFSVDYLSAPRRFELALTPGAPSNILNCRTAGARWPGLALCEQMRHRLSPGTPCGILPFSQSADNKPLRQEWWDAAGRRCCRFRIPQHSITCPGTCARSGSFSPSAFDCYGVLMRSPARRRSSNSPRYPRYVGGNRSGVARVSAHLDPALNLHPHVSWLVRRLAGSRRDASTLASARLKFSWGWAASSSRQTGARAIPRAMLRQKFPISSSPRLVLRKPG